MTGVRGALEIREAIQAYDQIRGNPPDQIHNGAELRKVPTHPCPAARFTCGMTCCAARG